ncbi:mpv17-like protein isoform X2 [Girardinichthys multiradiatus]|uniref:mpv17-like protein isoform X2 n=1 Tax=Girardinichthys multiradiatus TaxID=208333 RepID=UPI001FACB401|nr:mpv17-like protein isoform X2 [Girardinichthys multiradiatus]
MRKAVFKEAAKRFPWLANVTLYGCLFAGGDLAHQLVAQRERIDWKHTRNVAIVAITFQGNFNYFWLRALERCFPGKSAGMVFRKLLLDQSFASPLATSVFYTDWTHVLALHAVSELRPDAAAHAHSLHGLLRVPLGLLSVFLTAERGWHCHRGPGIHHGPPENSRGDARGSVGSEEA